MRKIGIGLFFVACCFVGTFFGAAERTANGATNFCTTSFSINQCLAQLFNQEAHAAPNYCTTSYSVNQCLNQISTGGGFGLISGGPPNGTPITDATDGNCLYNDAGHLNDAACGSGGGGSPGGATGNVQINAGAGNFGGITDTQLTALINTATASLSGALPAWPNNTTTFFRGDGSYDTLNCAALSGVAASCATDTTNASNISSGTLAGARMATATSSTQGALPAWPGNTTTFFRGDGTYDTLNCAALSGVAASCSTDATNASNISSGTLNSARLPTGVAFLNVADQTLSGGANLTVNSLSAGAVTVDCGKNPGQYIPNTGAFTLTAPTSDGECIVQIENGTGAGTVTFSGFSEGSNTGDALDTTSGHLFQLSIIRIHAASHYLITALQ